MVMARSVAGGAARAMLSIWREAIGSNYKIKFLICGAGTSNLCANETVGNCAEHGSWLAGNCRANLLVILDLYSGEGLRPKKSMEVAKREAVDPLNDLSGLKEKATLELRFGKDEVDNVVIIQASVKRPVSRQSCQRIFTSHLG